MFTDGAIHPTSSGTPRPLVLPLGYEDGVRATEWNIGLLVDRGQGLRLTLRDIPKGLKILLYGPGNTGLNNEGVATFSSLHISSSLNIIPIPEENYHKNYNGGNESHV